MRPKPIWLRAAVALLIPAFAFAGDYGDAQAVSHSSYASGTTPQGVARDRHGRFARSRHAKDEFTKSNPCPSTGKSRGACPGYVIDHVTPLKRGGADSPSNMQWQTKQAAKEKDRTE